MEGSFAAKPFAAVALFVALAQTAILGSMIEGRASILPGFPANAVHAWSCVVGGGALLFVAAIKMMVEVMHANKRPGAANDDAFSR